MANTGNRKTKTMLRLEREFSCDIETLFVRLIREHGRAGAADKLGISKALVTYWALKLGFRAETVLLRDGESVQIVREVKP